MLTTPVTMHDKETFREYLQFIGIDKKEAAQISKRLRIQEGTRSDYQYFENYLEGKRQLHEHINDL